MKEYLFWYNTEKSCVIVEGDNVRYEWPLIGPDRRFTNHLLSRMLSSGAQYRLITQRVAVLALVKDDALQGYLPPDFRPVSNKKPLWDRFINLFKKEKHYARPKNTGRTE